MIFLIMPSPLFILLGGGVIHYASDNYVVPMGATEIKDRQFSGNTEITYAVIPPSVTSIGGYAFLDCSSLTNIIIPSSVEIFGDKIFARCMKLTGVTISNGIQSVAAGIFTLCNSIKEITIPDSVTKIEQGAFFRCTSLTKITVKAITPPTLSTDAFDEADKITNIYVPSESIEAYKAAKGWKNYANKITAIPS